MLGFFGFHSRAAWGFWEAAQRTREILKLIPSGRPKEFKTDIRWNWIAFFQFLFSIFDRIIHAGCEELPTKITREQSHFVHISNLFHTSLSSPSQLSRRVIATTAIYHWRPPLRRVLLRCRSFPER